MRRIPQHSLYFRSALLALAAFFLPAAQAYALRQQPPAESQATPTALDEELASEPRAGLEESIAGRAARLRDEFRAAVQDRYPKLSVKAFEQGKRNPNYAPPNSNLADVMRSLDAAVEVYTYPGWTPSIYNVEAEFGQACDELEKLLQLPGPDPGATWDEDLHSRLTHLAGRMRVFMRDAEPWIEREGKARKQVHLLEETPLGPGVLILQPAALSRRPGLERLIGFASSSGLLQRIVIFGEGAVLPVLTRDAVLVVQNVEELIQGLRGMPAAEWVTVLGDAELAERVRAGLPSSRVSLLEADTAFRYILAAMGVPGETLDPLDSEELEQELEKLRNA